MQNQDDDGKPATGKELLEALVKSGFIGAWKDRTDIVDSVEFARRLRALTETRDADEGMRLLDTEAQG